MSEENGAGDRESFYEKSKEVIRDLLLNSAAARVMIEVGRIATGVAILYVIVCGIGEWLVFLLKILRIVIERALA